MLQSKIKLQYEIHDKTRICQGDILRDYKFLLVEKNNLVKEYFFPYLVIISQDCDLEQYSKTRVLITNPAESNKNTQYLPNILFLPAFLKEEVKDGIHLKKIYNIEQDSKNSKQMPLIIQNKDERYHYLDGYQEYQIPELVIDFKSYLTLPTENLFNEFKDHYLATLNELFREKLSQRFAYYLSRIGLPVI